MAHKRVILIAALSCLAALACGTAQAQAHGPPAAAWKKSEPDLNDPVQRAAMMETQGNWLGRLVGKFRYEGVVQVSFGDDRPVSGTQECARIGEGPGLLCSIGMSWPDIGSSGMRGPYTYWDPAMALYGIGPTAAEITFMQVDARSYPEGVPAKLRDGDTLRFLVPCVNEPPLCRRIVRITARPDGAPIQMKIDVWGDYFGDMLPALTYLVRLLPMPETATE